MNIVILSMLIFSACQTTIYAAEGGKDQQERRLMPRAEDGGEDQARQLALAEQHLQQAIEGAPVQQLSPEQIARQQKWITNPIEMLFENRAILEQFDPQFFQHLEKLIQIKAAPDNYTEKEYEDIIMYFGSPECEIACTLNGTFFSNYCKDITLHMFFRNLKRFEEFDNLNPNKETRELFKIRRPSNAELRALGEFLTDNPSDPTPATPISMNPILGLLTLRGAIGATTARVFGNLNHWWTSGVNANVSMAGDFEAKEIRNAESNPKPQRNHFAKEIVEQLDAATAAKASQQFKPERSAGAVIGNEDFAAGADLDDQLALALRQSAEEAGIAVPAAADSVREHARDLYSGLAAGAPAVAQRDFMLLDNQPAQAPAAPDLPQAQRQRPRPAQPANPAEIAAAAARERERLAQQQQALAAGPGVAYMQLDNVELGYAAGAAAAAYVPQRRPSRSGTHADAVAAAQQPSAFGPGVSHVSLDGSGAQRHPRTSVFAQANPAYANPAYTATGFDLSTLSEDEQVKEAMRRSLED